MQTILGSTLNAPLILEANTPRSFNLSCGNPRPFLTINADGTVWWDEELCVEEAAISFLRTLQETMKDMLPNLAQSTMGVGDGSGELFVHGSDDAIRAARDIVDQRDLYRNQVRRLEEQLATALRQLVRVTDERNGWHDSAGMMSRNADFYRGLIEEMGNAIGPMARMRDDGTLGEDVLALVVRDIVVDSYAPINKVAETQFAPPSLPKRIRSALRMIFTGK